MHLFALLSLLPLLLASDLTNGDSNEQGEPVSLIHADSLPMEPIHDIFSNKNLGKGDSPFVEEIRDDKLSTSVGTFDVVSEAFKKDDLSANSPTVAPQVETAVATSSSLPLALRNFKVPQISEAWKMRAKTFVKSRPAKFAATVIVVGGVAYACTQAFPEAYASCVQVASDNLNHLHTVASNLATEALNAGSDVISVVSTTGSNFVAGAQEAGSNFVNVLTGLPSQAQEKALNVASEAGKQVGWICQEGSNLAVHLQGKVYVIGHSLKTPFRQVLSGLWPTASTVPTFDNQTMCAAIYNQ